MNWKLYVLIFFSTFGWSQNFYLKIEGTSSYETSTIDSISYIKKHINVQKIIKEDSIVFNKLQQKGYLGINKIKQIKINDTTFSITYKLGIAYKKVKIKTDSLSISDKKLLEIQDSFVLKTEEIESFLTNKINYLEQKGFPLTKLQLRYFDFKNNEIEAQLICLNNLERKINALVIEGYNYFPKAIKRVYERKYQNKIFNQKTIGNIHKDFNTLSFVSQVKYPEVLLTTDSTKVYVYTKKRKNNTFDGFVGFGTNEEKQKLQFNGYLDLNLFNNLNAGERFNLYWKNDGNKQSTFQTQLDLAYVFKTRLALRGNLKLFKQDSIFQNSSYDLQIGYLLKYNTKWFLGIKNNTSTSIQKITPTNIDDLTANFYTTTFEHRKMDYNQNWFTENFFFITEIGYGKRNNSTTTTNQFYTHITSFKLFQLNPRNYIHIKTDQFYLQSSDYYINELYRLGGMQSIRGFNENSLQGNFFSGLFAEYRFIAASNLYFYTVTDYGYLQDKTSKTNTNLYGFGLGMGLLSNNGIFNLVYANGSSSGQEIKLSNSIVQVSFKTNF